MMTFNEKGGGGKEKCEQSTELDKQKSLVFVFRVVVVVLIDYVCQLINSMSTQI